MNVVPPKNPKLSDLLVIIYRMDICRNHLTHPRSIHVSQTTIDMAKQLQVGAQSAHKRLINGSSLHNNHQKHLILLPFGPFKPQHDIKIDQ